MDGNELRGPFCLKGRLALITGATGYFGQVFARALCDFGASAIMVARNEKKLTELQQKLERDGYNSVEIHPMDLRNDHDIRRLAKELKSKYGKLDIVVNNANSGATATVETAEADSFDLASEITLRAPFRIVQLLLPLLSKAASENAGGSSIVNIASMYGLVSPDPSIYGDSGFNNPPYYGAAKAGLIQLTRYLACHLAGDNIRVNSISPGPFPPISIQQDQPEFYEKLCRKVPLGRIGTPRELVGALVFLASDASSYVTGIDIPIDGGWTAW